MDIEMSDIIGANPLWQMVGVNDAATTYIQVDTFSPSPSSGTAPLTAFQVETNTLVVSASGFQDINSFGGVTAFCNSVGTTVNCQFDTLTLEGPPTTRVFEVAPTSLIPASSTTPLPSETNSPVVANLSSPNRTMVIIGAVVGSAVIIVLMLLTWWLVRRHRRRKVLWAKSGQEVISPFHPRDTSHIAGPLSMHSPIFWSIARSKRAEMQEKARARMDVQEELRATQEALNRARESHGEEATLRQQMFELIERVRRMEEVVNDHPPDYQSQP
ncbi:hypothetical protein BDP27DRAFT_1418382 [Rhodocollybia butyracea]|uniref:Uncharacterized protein n=1 Tax=Rhodocollybia butyracea TaxID=206335 RepID=A0A9P5PZ27_9AGAR|nr:hypothetical protein BDP27DRAFT_1418382 [Rhodocollybia butyracea]